MEKNIETSEQQELLEQFDAEDRMIMMSQYQLQQLRQQASLFQEQSSLFQQQSTQHQVANKQLLNKVANNNTTTRY